MLRVSWKRAFESTFPNQGYTDSPNFNMLFFKLFGRGAGNVGQYPLYDTLFDMMAAVLGIIMAIIISLVLERVLKSRKGKQ